METIGAPNFLPGLELGYQLSSYFMGNESRTGNSFVRDLINKSLFNAFVRHINESIALPKNREVVVWYFRNDIPKRHVLWIDKAVGYIASPNFQLFDDLKKFKPGLIYRSSEFLGKLYSDPSMDGYASNSEEFSTYLTDKTSRASLYIGTDGQKIIENLADTAMAYFAQILVTANTKGSDNIIYLYGASDNSYTYRGDTNNPKFQIIGLLEGEPLKFVPLEIERDLKRLYKDQSLELLSISLDWITEKFPRLVFKCRSKKSNG